MDIRQQIKDRAKSHWAERGTKSIDVPEWGCTIHYKSPNLATLRDVMADSKGDAIEAQARIVVACGADESGQRIWQKAEYLDLMKFVDPDIVARIANAIMARSSLSLTPADMADDEKN